VSVAPQGTGFSHWLGFGFGAGFGDIGVCCLVLAFNGTLAVWEIDTLLICETI
jgi:hypothetical protein